MRPRGQAPDDGLQRTALRSAALRGAGEAPAIGPPVACRSGDVDLLEVKWRPNTASTRRGYRLAIPARLGRAGSGERPDLPRPAPAAEAQTVGRLTR